MMNVIYSLENVGKDFEKLCTPRNPRFLLELAASFCLPFSGFAFLMMKSNYEMRRDVQLDQRLGKSMLKIQYRNQNMRSKIVEKTELRAMWPGHLVAQNERLAENIL